MTKPHVLSSSLVNALLPQYDFRSVYSIPVDATPQRIMACVKSFEAGPNPLVRAIGRLRNWCLGPAHAQSVKCFDQRCLMALGDGNRNAVAFGMIGKFEDGDCKLRDFSSAEAFQAWDENDACKLVIGYHCSGTPELPILVIETRITWSKTRMPAKFALYWFCVRMLRGFIRRRMLRAIKALAESAQNEAKPFLPVPQHSAS